MSRAARTPWLLVCSLFLMASCYQPGGPVPETPVDPPLKTPVPQQVTVEQELIYSPYPRENGEIPASYVCGWDCDSIRFTRYRPDKTPADADTIGTVAALL